MTDSLTEKVARAMAVARVNATTNLPSAYPKSPLDQMAECSAHIDALAAHYLPDARAARESILAQIEVSTPLMISAACQALAAHLDLEFPAGMTKPEADTTRARLSIAWRAMVRALREGK